MRLNFKWPGKLAIVLVGVALIYFGFRQLDSRGYLDKYIGAKIEKPTLPQGVPDSTPVVNVGVVTWGGYAGGEYFNEGFKASTESRYYKKYGILVNFIVIDDFNPSRDAWKTDSVDVLWTTADAFTTEAGALARHEPKIIFQADWSRGGDAIVVRRGINSANDLRGKKVSFAEGTPSHTFLIMMLKSAGINYNEIKVIKASNAVESAALFKAGKVDAAVVWSPDDDDCVKSVPGSKVLQSTREAKHIIADVFFAKRKWLENHQKEAKALVEGWMTGAAEINSSDEAKKKAANILAKGLNQPYDFCLNAINNTRLTTYGDNVNFFNVQGNYLGVKGEELYSNMTEEYKKIDFMSTAPPPWREVTDLSILRSLSLSGPQHIAEGEEQFSAPTAQLETAAGVSTKAVTVNFDTGSATLSEAEKDKIQSEFGQIARSFTGNRIRIEGNTDITGDRNMNIALSKQRAHSVARFLVNTYRFDPNRFIIVGHGPDNPVCQEDNDDCYAKNRRTDFVMVEGDK